MKIGIVTEKTHGETRVAASPDTCKLLKNIAENVLVESGAGLDANFSDAEYIANGAEIADAEKILKTCDIILKVRAPSINEASLLKNGATIIGLLVDEQTPEVLKKYNEQKINSFALEYLPRITRAQSMDVLSSQSNLAGYKAVIEAVNYYGRVVPMMVTAAGTIRPAKFLILGAGVAGLQALATAKRLGGVVSVFDVRPEVKEQVQSLGGIFVEVPTDHNKDEQLKENSPYAKEMSKEYQLKQKDLINQTIRTQDIIITTALIPFKKAPILITKDMVKTMLPGSIIVDLAAGMGGNCELTIPNEIVQKYGVNIMGFDNITSKLAQEASRLYARNIFNFMSLIISEKLARLKINFDDEIIQKTMLTHNGKTIHPAFRQEILS